MTRLQLPPQRPLQPPKRDLRAMSAARQYPMADKGLDTLMEEAGEEEKDEERPPLLLDELPFRVPESFDAEGEV